MREPESSSIRRTYGLADLTINICTVDRHDQLLACMDSLLRTTPAAVSLNVVFNGTPRATIEAAEKRIAEWNGPTNQRILAETVPVTVSHNLALSMALTPLINFMGDDDLVLGNRLPRIVQAYNDLEVEPLAVTTFARRIAGHPASPRIGSNKDLGPTTVAEWRSWKDAGQMFEMLWPGAVLSTEALREIGGFEADFDRTFDNRIFTRLSAAGPVLSLPERHFGYRIHEGSLSTSNFLLQSQQVRHVRACRTAEHEGRSAPSRAEFVEAEADDPILQRTRRYLRAKSRMHFRRGSAFLLEGGRKPEAVRHLLTSAILWPPAFIEKVLDQGQPLRALKP